MIVFHVVVKTFSSPDGRVGSDARNSAPQRFSVFVLKFKFKRPFLWEVEIFAIPTFITPVFWEHHILYYLDTASFRYLRNDLAFLWFLPSRFVCSCTKLSPYQRSQHDGLSLAGHIFSSVPPSKHTAALAHQRSAVQCHSLEFPGVRCGTASCCALLCGAVPCCAVVSALLYLLSFC